MNVRTRKIKGDTTNESTCRTYFTNANSAFVSKFWNTLYDNGTQYERYIHVEDWDGTRRDFGDAYITLEAAMRGIITSTNRNYLWWLDRGQYKIGSAWYNDIYSIWEVAPPYNTIDMYGVYSNLTGTCPYREVLTNGGTRLNIAACDLMTRARSLTIDNMHERNLRVLSRYMSPDRLTGGRTKVGPPPDPYGGRGRWQFLGPNIDIQDIEGFREIFEQNGTVASLEPAYYMGFTYTGDGLKLNPWVPSGMTKVKAN